MITCSAALAFIVGCTATTSAAEASKVDHDQAQITILYDAFGRDPAMQRCMGACSPT